MTDIETPDVPTALDLFKAIHEFVPDAVYENETGGGNTMTALYLPHYHVVYADTICPIIGWHAAFDDFEYDNAIEEEVWLDAHDDRPGWHCAPTLDELVSLFREYADKARKAESDYGNLSEDARVVLTYLQQTECDGPLAFFTLILEDGGPLGDDPQRLGPALDELIDAEFLSHEGVIDPLGGAYLLTLKGGNAEPITGDDPRFRH